MKLDLTSKKGQQISEIATVIIVMFALPFIFITVALAFDEVNQGFQDNLGDEFNLSKEMLASNESQFVPITDNGFLIILIGLILAGIASLFVLNTHPFMFIVTAIGIIALLLVAAMMQNSFSDLTEDGGLGEQKSRYVFIPLIMENMYFTVVVIAFIFTIAFFAKLRLSG